MLSDNKRATVGMPIYLIIAITIASIIIAIFSISILTIKKESETDKVKTEIEKIISEAENMFEYADEGTLARVHVNFPESMKFIVFGSMPKNGLSEPVDYKLDENTSNNYYFVMEDKTIFISSSNARFSGKSTEKFAFFRSGFYDLSIELIKTSGKSYVKIY